MYVFWDWNGTLCDDVLLSLAAVNAMLQRRNRPPIGLQTYYQYIDTPISKFYAHLFDFSEVPMETISAEFHGYYAEHLRMDCLMPGAYETLCTLRDAGVHQILLSSSHRDAVYPIIRRLGLLPFFEELLLTEEWSVPSKTERAKRYCEQHGLQGEDVWFIGDLLHDKDAADACKASCLLIPDGHQSPEDLQKTGACFCRSVRDVPARLGISGNTSSFP